MIKTPVLVRDGRRFVDEETIIQFVSDVDPALAVTLNRYILDWEVVPVEDADNLGDFDCPYCGHL